MEKSKSAIQNAVERSNSVKLSDGEVGAVTIMNLGGLGGSVELKVTDSQGKIIKKEIVLSDDRKN